MNPDNAIEARGLTKRFGKLTAVDALDLDVPRGRIYGFLGPNGSGKSTSIRMLCGLLTPTSGTANVLGTHIPGDTAELKPKIGYMTQSFSLFADMTVVENLQFIADIYSLPRAARKARIEELLVRYNLVPKRNALAGTLSGGQRQYLALASAVLHRPELLLLDEPTSAVDPQSRRDFWTNLFRLAKAGTTILLSTHYMDEAERCHRLAILARGVKVADGTPEALRQQTGMQVVEIDASDPWAAQEVLDRVTGIASVTQLGMRLRALVPDTVSGPEFLVRQSLAQNGIDAKTCLTAPSLEDVFVAATLHTREQAA
jgi:ABC-2 type transport system ATP-binding protein